MRMCLSPLKIKANRIFVFLDKEWKNTKLYGECDPKTSRIQWFFDE